MEIVTGAAISISQFGHVVASGTTRTDYMVEWMVRAGSSYQIGLVRTFLGLSESGGGISKMEIVPCAAMSISQFVHAVACSTTRTGSMAEWMVRASSACQLGPVHDCLGLSDTGGGISKVEIVPTEGISISQFGHIVACGTTTTDFMAEWMVRANSA